MVAGLGEEGLGCQIIAQPITDTQLRQRFIRAGGLPNLPNGNRTRKKLVDCLSNPNVIGNRHAIVDLDLMPMGSRLGDARIAICNIFRSKSTSLQCGNGTDRLLHVGRVLTRRRPLQIEDLPLCARRPTSGSAVSDPSGGRLVTSAFSQSHPVADAVRQRLVIDVVMRAVRIATVVIRSVADPDIGPRLLLQHEGEVLGGHARQN